MCDQPVPKNVEAVFRKPKAQWSPEDHAIVKIWTDEPLHNSKLDPETAQRHYQSRLSYIDVAELFFKPYAELSAAERNSLHTWLNHECRRKHFRTLLIGFLIKQKKQKKQKKMSYLIESVDLNAWVKEFLQDFFANKLIDRFDPLRNSLYGYIAGDRGALCFWCLQKSKGTVDQRAKERQQIDAVETEDEINDALPPVSLHRRSPEEILAYADLFNLINSLQPARYGEAWLLYHVEGLSYPEIAKHFGIREGNARTIVSRAAQELRAVLDNEHAEYAKSF
ncbi:RNA polymerase sigma factor [Methylomicrobium sp. RS1]|uniref:RNA polymerase sigma factor n=1 Tax=Candidatus Methylomicrobium oryzae TaxID=2802053 RepID=UPI001923B004|nr:RNA polymerase sigma factor [Methylomicrobium sp. RS1]MBL1263512.1 RNA polymerase sigma factor [Methylomicrobium sp. RS1]